MAAGVLTAFLLTGLAGCGAAGIAGPVTEEETDEQETESAVDVGEQGSQKRIGTRLLSRSTVSLFPCGNGIFICG